jgi:Cu(I)/Ag(I) efflux system membrane fusion protein
MKLQGNRIKILIVMVIVLVTAGAVVWFGPVRSHRDHSASQGEQLYTCGMHPQIIRNKPGTCPICGMKLTPILRQTKGMGVETNGNSGVSGERKVKYYKSTMLLGEISKTLRKDSMGMDMVPVFEEEATDSRVISIDPSTSQNMNLRIRPVTTGPVRRHIRTVGVVDFDETTLVDVTTKFKGWIETLHLDATGKQAHKGEPLFEIYSPELYSAQAEYLLALNQPAGTPGAESLKASALTKLKFFDISDAQIAELEKSRRATKTLSVNAPRDGIVVEKMAVQGQMVDSGMRLYRLADLGIVWVLAQVYEQDLAFVHLGQEAVVGLSYLPDRKFRGRVTYIYPTVDEKTRTARVRMEFHNPGYFLKPGMFATVELDAELAAMAVLAPDSAILRSGEKNTAFVALEGGKFEPRVVTLGSRSENGMYQILNGLSEGERVVISGQFMLDSESQLREAIQKMIGPGTPPATEPQHTSHAVADTNASAAMRGATAYICPMPEHVSLKYPNPGKCPLCGMALVPVSAELLSQIEPGGRVTHYTCPMPEHADVHAAKPGKCSRCGMTLIPVMQRESEPTSSKPVEHKHGGS